MYTSFSARAIGLSLSAREAIDLASLAGFEGVDLLVRDLVERGDDLREIRSSLDDAGLRGGAWPLPVAWRGDESTFARDLERLPRLAEAAAFLGLYRTGTWVMPETPTAFAGLADPAARREATRRFHEERLAAIARVLGRHGVRLGLEVIGVEASRTGTGDPFVHRLADLVRVFGPLRNEVPNLGILLDGFHLYAAGESIDEGLGWGVEGIVWLHVADLPATAPRDRSTIRDHDRGLPGEHAAVNTRILLQRLAESGYDGPVTAEPLAGCRALEGLNAEQSARRVAEALRAVWPATTSV